MAARERARKRSDHGRDIAPKVHEHGDERAHVTRNVKCKTVAAEIPPEKSARQDEMPRARYGQELRQPLHDAEQRRRQQVHDRWL